MAILIRKDHTMSEIRPQGTRKLTVDDIADILHTTKDCLFIKDCINFLAFTDSADLDGYNPIATSFTGEIVKSDCILIAGSQIKKDKIVDSYLTPLNTSLSGKEFDDFIVSTIRIIEEELKKYEAPSRVKSTIQISKDGSTRVIEQNPKQLLDEIEKNLGISKKSKVFLDLEKVYEAYEKSKEIDADTDENGFVKDKKVKITEKDLVNIIEKAYAAFEDNKGKVIDKNNFMMFFDKSTEIWLDPDKAEDTVSYLMGYFVDREEYEKCAVLRDVKFA